MLENRQARVERHLVVLHRQLALDRGILDLVQGQVEVDVEPCIADRFQFIGKTPDAARQRRGIRVAQEIRGRAFYHALDAQMFFVLAQFGDRRLQAGQLQTKDGAGVAAHFHVVTPENGLAIDA